MRNFAIAVCLLGNGCSDSETENTLKEHEDSLSEVGEQVGSLAQELRQRVSALEEELTQLKAQLETNTDVIDSNTSAISANATDIAANEERIATNASGIEDNVADIAAHTTRLRARHAELLFAWDGDDRYLGRVLEYGVHRLLVVMPGLTVPVEIRPLGGTISFTGAGCTGTPYLTGHAATSTPPALLVKSTGDIYVPTGIHIPSPAKQSELTAEFGGGCTASGGAPSSGLEVSLFSTLPAFSEGVVVTTMQY